MNPERDLEEASIGGGDTLADEQVEFEWDAFADGDYDKICHPDQNNSWQFQTTSKSTYDNIGLTFSPWSYSRTPDLSPEVTSMRYELKINTYAPKTLVWTSSEKLSSCNSFYQTAFCQDDDEFYSLHSTEYYSCRSEPTSDPFQTERKHIEFIFSTINTNLDIKMISCEERNVLEIENWLIENSRGNQEKAYNCEMWLEVQASYVKRGTARSSSSSIAVLSQSEDSMMEIFKHSLDNIPCKSLSDAAVGGNGFDALFQENFNVTTSMHDVLLKDHDTALAGEVDDAHENDNEFDQIICSTNNIPSQQTSESCLAKSTATDEHFTIDRFDKLNDLDYIKEQVSQTCRLVEGYSASFKESTSSQDLILVDERLKSSSEFPQAVATLIPYGINSIPTGHIYPYQITVPMETSSEESYDTGTSDNVQLEVTSEVVLNQSKDDQNSVEAQQHRSDVTSSMESLSVDSDRDDVWENCFDTNGYEDPSATERSSGADKFVTAITEDMLNNTTPVKSLIKVFEEFQKNHKEDRSVSFDDCNRSTTYM